MNKTEVLRLRITPELKADVAAAAAADNRTMSGFIETLLKKAVEEFKKQGGE